MTKSLEIMEPSKIRYVSMLIHEGNWYDGIAFYDSNENRILGGSKIWANNRKNVEWTPKYRIPDG